MKRVKLFLYPFFLAGVVALLTRCGQPICVVDWGNCSVYNNWANSGTPSAGTLVLNAPANNVMIYGGTFTFIPSGGTPPYAFTINPTGVGTWTPSSTQAIFTAPQYDTQITITVTDATNLTASQIITVQQNY